MFELNYFQVGLNLFRYKNNVRLYDQANYITLRSETMSQINFSSQISLHVAMKVTTCNVFKIRHTPLERFSFTDQIVKKKFEMLTNNS